MKTRRKFQGDDGESNCDNESSTFNSSNAGLNQDKVEIEYREEQFQKECGDLKQLDWKKSICRAGLVLDNSRVK